jgi:catechol 2,3-dioxygenase-like lactoylglutathione lyase family enzyme
VTEATSAGLGATVTALQPFVPCDDFELSRKFYAEIGFEETFAGDGMAVFACGAYSFLLQNYKWPSARRNYMVQLQVNDVDAWWRRLEPLDLPGRYGAKVAAPADQPWGARVMFLHDPTGVLWHISQFGQ